MSCALNLYGKSCEDRRRKNRDDMANFVTSVVVWPGDGAMPCWIRNIGTGKGIGLWTPEALPVGKVVHIGGTDLGPAVECRILWCREQSHGEGYIAGGEMVPSTP